MRPDPPKLHAVTDESIADRPDLELLVRQIAISPSVALHARGRRLPGRRLYSLATCLQEGARRGRARILVNDRADVCLAVGADGIHLPSEGLPVQTARDLVGEHRWIGCSTHSPQEALTRTAEGADYIFLGPIWESASHPGRPALGPGAISSAQPARIVAIGGVTAARTRTCLEHGAYGVAAISSLWLAEDPGAAAEEMLLLLNEVK